MTTKIDTYFDLFDQAAMIYYDALGLDYLQGFLKTAKGITEEEIDSKLNDEQTEKLEAIFHNIRSLGMYNEEIRLALELLIVKAFKHIQYRLTLMTPDTVNYLLANMIIRKFHDHPDITILDTALGTANMLQAIANHFPGKTKLLGIEDDRLLADLAKASADLQGNEISIYYQDALADVMETADVVVGDLDSYILEDGSGPLYEDGVRYFPYLVIAKRLMNIRNGGYFMYVIENDFFEQEKNNVFRSYLSDKATLMALIVLPSSMFKENYVGKSIIIGKKQVMQSHSLMIYEIPSFEEESLKKSIAKINEMIELI